MIRWTDYNDTERKVMLQQAADAESLPEYAVEIIYAEQSRVFEKAVDLRALKIIDHRLAQIDTD